MMRWQELSRYLGRYVIRNMTASSRAREDNVHPAVRYMIEFIIEDLYDFRLSHSVIIVIDPRTKALFSE